MKVLSIWRYLETFSWETTTTRYYFKFPNQGNSTSQFNDKIKKLNNQNFLKRLLMSNEGG